MGLFGLELVSRLGVCSDTGGLVANWLFAGLFCLCVLRMCWFVAGVLGFACCVFVCFANLWVCVAGWWVSLSGFCRWVGLIAG